MTSVTDRIMRMDEKVEKASIRRDNAVRRYWKLLGWGTSAEVEKAKKSMVSAIKWSSACEDSLRRLTKFE